MKADEKITVEVPIHLAGTADGVRNHGGVMDQVMHKIEIRVFPADIPEHVEVDVTNVAIGHSIFVRDITVRQGRHPEPARSADLLRRSAPRRNRCHA